MILRSSKHGSCCHFYEPASMTLFGGPVKKFACWKGKQAVINPPVVIILLGFGYPTIDTYTVVEVVKYSLEMILPNLGLKSDPKTKMPF